MAGHEYFIILIISAIIGLQIFIFFKNIRKINRYKKTIESVKDFDLVEVSVPEEWIKDIEVDEILNDPERFQKVSTSFSSHTEDPITQERNLENQEVVTSYGEDFHPVVQEIDDDEQIEYTGFEEEAVEQEIPEDEEIEDFKFSEEEMEPEISKEDYEEEEFDFEEVRPNNQKK